MTSYPQIFRLLEDNRSQEQKTLHHNEVEELTKRNLKNLNVQITPKSKIEYPETKLVRVDLQDGWWVQITDTKAIDKKYTIVTMHGCPGDHREWAGLEYYMKDYVRWVNIVVPGFDLIDQRRGTYNGSVQHVSQLIIQLIHKLEIKKMVLCGHSMGGLFLTYFSTWHPEYLFGRINITGPVHRWYIGLKTFYNHFVISNNFDSNYSTRNSLLDLQPLRKRVTETSNNRARQINFNNQVQFPILSESQIFGYIKFANSVPHGMSSLFEYNRQIGYKYLCVYLFGKIDPIEQIQLTEEMMYRVSNNNRVSNTLTAQTERRIIEKCSQLNVKLDTKNLQSNFVFNFEQTGHNLHKRRPKEAAKVIQTYLMVLQEIEMQGKCQQSKL